jgi:TorA maturation chaperone TorD
MELLRALAVLAELPTPEHSAVARSLGLPPPDAADYTDLFTAQLYPYASVYLGNEGMLGGDARERIAGFWRALQLMPPAEPDHLATLLALFADIVQRSEEAQDEKTRAALEHAARALLWEHMMPWLPPYLRKMQSVARGGYAQWTALLSDALAAAAERYGPEPALSAHLRAAETVEDPRDAGADAFIATLLAPVRSGVVFVRADLQRAAREQRLGLRQGERRYALKALLAQDRVAVLAWLGAEARASSTSYRGDATIPAGVRDFWAGRADTTAQLLASLHSDAAEAAVAVS